MQYTKREENIERLYSLDYDEEELRNLLDELIDRVSLKYSGECSAWDDEILCIDRQKNIYEMKEKLPNGKPKYDNIRFRNYFHSGALSDVCTNALITFDADVTSPPELAYIIGKILNDDPSGIDEFLSYPEHDELVSIDDKIAKADEELSAISNFDIEKKSRALTHLSHLLKLKECNKFYDTKLLKHYYERAYNLIGIRLVSETKHIGSEKMLLKSFFVDNKSSR